MELWSKKPYSTLQQQHREGIEQHLLPTHGCVPLDDYAAEVYDNLKSAAVAFNLLWDMGDMPVLKYGDDFKQWRAGQIAVNDELRKGRICCTLPWQVLKYLDPSRKESDRLYWSQGNVGSCMAHSDAFAWHSAVLQLIARGSPLKYTSINPIVTWAITKGGSMRGGQTVSEMAKGANEIGHFIESLVGTDNQHLPDYKQYTGEATRYQSAVMFLDFRGEELCDEIFSCCRAGLSVSFGNSNAVRGCSIDKNGVKVAIVGGGWAHATHMTGYRKVGDTEYVGWVNSHGPIYKSSDEGEPADMCWMDRKSAVKFCSTMHLYGSPYIVFPESITILDRSLYVGQAIPWPENWRD